MNIVYGFGFLKALSISLPYMKHFGHLILLSKLCYFSG